MSKADGKDETLPNHTIIHWGEHAPNDLSRRKRRVTCGWCGEAHFVRPHIGSKSHPNWSGFHRPCVTASKLTDEDVDHVSGTRIHWSERDPEAPSKRVKITCHECQQKVFDSVKAISSEGWSGRCAECRQRDLASERTGKVSLGRSMLDWDKPDPKNPKRYEVTCGGDGCGLPWYVSTDQISRIRKKNLNGFCPKCSGAQRRKSGDEKHHTGTIVHWGDRHPDNPYSSIRISCHKCGEKKYVHKKSIDNSSWHGLCSDCLEEHGIPGQRRTLTGTHTNPFGAVIDFEAPHTTGTALVQCPNFSTCGGASLKQVASENKDTQPFYCDFCSTLNKTTNLSAAWDAVKAAKVVASGNGLVATDQVPLLSDFEQRVEEILPLIKQAQRLANASGCKEWHAVVRRDYPDLVTEVISMLRDYKLSVCAREQIARKDYRCSYRTLLRKRDAQNPTTASATSG